jgi:hypothetical protein
LSENNSSVAIDEDHDMEKPPDGEKPGSPSAADKKPYHTPNFSIYGEVREITQTIVGGTGMNDQIHGNDKTSP